MDALSENDFTEQILELEGRAVVAFWAEWCGPCRMVTPVLEGLEQEHPDLSFATVDVDENPDLARLLQVSSIPTILVFERGKVQKRIVGALPRGKLLEELADWLT